MTDWIMIIITSVYVVATIFICVANFKSAKATREQLEESRRQHEEAMNSAKEQFEESKRQFEEQKKQFEETNRPYISCEYLLVDRRFCAIRIKNYGNKPAQNVTFCVNKEFIDCVPITFKHFFANINYVEYYFGINQYYDFYFSDKTSFEQNKTNFNIDISYECEDKKYKNTVKIDFEKQLPVFSTTEQQEKELNALNNIANAISKNR